MNPKPRRLSGKQFPSGTFLLRQIWGNSMRNTLSVAALLVFVVSSGLLEIVRHDDRPITALPPAMGEFAPANVDTTAVTSGTGQ